MTVFEIVVKLPLESIAFTCKSRFCSSCGYKYKNDRVENILQIAYNCQHRQIVFTIPKELRQYFFSHFEDKINLLFKARELLIKFDSI